MTYEHPGTLSDAKMPDYTWHIAREHWAYASDFRLHHVEQIRDIAMMERARGNFHMEYETLKHIHPLN
jgi:hypothetical protein